MFSKVRGPDMSMETKATSHLWFHQAKVPPEQRNHAACDNVALDMQEENGDRLPIQQRTHKGP